MTFTDRETGMDRLYGGVVESSSRSAQGRVLFHLRFDAEFEGDSGDTVTLDAAELVDAIAWRHVPSSPRVTPNATRTASACGAGRRRRCHAGDLGGGRRQRSCAAAGWSVPCAPGARVGGAACCSFTTRPGISE